MSNGNGQPKTLQDWIRYLHVVRAVPPESPDYADAQEAMAFALQRIRTLNVVAGSQDRAAAATDTPARPVSPQTAVGATLAHGASLGTGEPIAELLQALGLGGGGAEQYRAGLEQLGVQQPLAATAGEFTGRLLSNLVPVTGAVQGGTATAAAIPSSRANMLARFFTGAGQTNVTPALTLGAVQGFSAGGEDPTDLAARAHGAAIGGGVGAAGAAAFGGLGALRVPRWLNTVKRDIRRALPKSTPPDVVEGMTEASIKQQLARQGFDAPTQDRILATWRAGKTEVPPPPMEPVTRPGETIMQGFRTRGVGGHSYAGTFPAGSGAGLPGRAASSPVGGPTTPQAIQLQQLQMLAQLPPADFEAAAALFPPDIIQQVRALRAQMVGGVLP